MPAFSLDLLETLDYDFTGFPSTKGGMCSGKGIVPEPTQAALDAYADATRKLYGITEDETPEQVTARIEEELKKAGGTKEQRAKSDEYTQAMIEIVADFCQQTPSVEELSEIPPRVRNAFMRWIQKEVANPEV